MCWSLRESGTHFGGLQLSYIEKELYVNTGRMLFRYLSETVSPYRNTIMILKSI